ncbi:Ubiquitin-protein ligase E3A [Smittium mucronatum]|uniref:HECT-type E3 ubiquitin transferase n=1 Tax=Smittium mucronatum TaxID=133383 RepID=A0A1R0H349_9FUNG|nr:Ubiquitin-protein ligase E3A [Smittium mucronatum]
MLLRHMTSVPNSVCDGFLETNPDSNRVEEIEIIGDCNTSNNEEDLCLDLSNSYHSVSTFDSARNPIFEIDTVEKLTISGSSPKSSLMSDSANSSQNSIKGLHSDCTDSPDDLNDGFSYFSSESDMDSLPLKNTYIDDMKSYSDFNNTLSNGYDSSVQKLDALISSIRERMFYVNNDSNMCWFSPEPESDALYMQEMRLVGMVLGLAVYNSPLHRSLIKILHSFSPEEIEGCDQTFEVSYEQNGQHQIYQLVPNGSAVKLTFENKIEFVNSYVDFIFNTSCESQFEVFRDGFLDIVGNSFAMNLSPIELELIICGSSDLDFDTLDKYAVYDGGFKRDTPVIEYFWSVVKSFPTELKKKLLFFTTGSDRVPIGGLSKMKFVIVKNGTDSMRLPTSHTCFNALLLPEYDSEPKLRERLITAINNSEGFGMM